MAPTTAAFKPTQFPDEINHVTANGVDFAYHELGTGPLALCLHGYPDTPWTFRYLIGELADAGYRVVVPYQRGYAPTVIPESGQYQCGVLGLDANALHDRLGGDEHAVVIGHDWGAFGTYAAMSLAPERWRAGVAAAVPPGPITAEGFFTYDQLKLSWYMFFQISELAEGMISSDPETYYTRLWNDWSPGYDATADVAKFLDAIPTPEHLTAVLTYYRHTLQMGEQDPALIDAQTAAYMVPEKPLLYLHGADDGCMSAELASKTPTVLNAEHSRTEIIEDAGHFLQLEQPEAFNQAVLEFLS